MSGIDPHAPILIVGTGLTMVDLVLGLREQGFQGRVIAASRRGLVPRRHAPEPQPWTIEGIPDQATGSILRLLRWIRRQVADAATRGIGWRAVIDALRPFNAAIWMSLSIAEQKRFLRHARPFWDVHRHRTAPPVADVIEALQRDGKLSIERARVTELAQHEDKITVRLEHAGNTLKTLDVQRVIRADGVPGLSGGLYAQLEAEGWIEPDAHGFGVRVTPDLRVMAGDEDAAPIWALGPAVRGVFWECTAVPDIRRQAEQIAGQITQYVQDMKIA